MRKRHVAQHPEYSADYRKTGNLSKALYHRILLNHNNEVSTNHIAVLFAHILHRNGDNDGINTFGPCLFQRFCAFIHSGIAGSNIIDKTERLT